MPSSDGTFFTARSIDLFALHHLKAFVVFSLFSPAYRGHADTSARPVVARGPCFRAREQGRGGGGPAGEGAGDRSRGKRRDAGSSCSAEPTRLLWLTFDYSLRGNIFKSPTEARIAVGTAWRLRVIHLLLQQDPGYTLTACFISFLPANKQVWGRIAFAADPNI